MRADGDCGDRDSRFELLRVVAMLLIVAAHLVAHGIMHVGDEGAYLAWSTGSVVNRVASASMFIGGRVGVALFFMLSGYFCVIRENSSGIAKTIALTAFYALLCSFVGFILTCRGEIGMTDVSLPKTLFRCALAIVTPLSGGGYWFVTVYVIIVLVQPLFNGFLRGMSGRGFRAFLLVFWILWYGVACITSPYYDVLRGFFFYSIGGYLRLHGQRLSKAKSLWETLLVVAWAVAAVATYNVGIIESSGISVGDSFHARTFDLVRTWLCVPMAAVSLFMLCSLFDIKSLVVNKVARATFAVYLIHDSAFLRSFLWGNVLHADTDLYQSTVFPVLAMVATVAVFAVCALIELVRQRILGRCLEGLTNKICSEFWQVLNK